MLFLELERRLKEIDEQARQCVKLCEFVRSDQPFKPAIAHDPPNDGAILLLDKGLIIFPLRSAAREFYSVAKAIVSNSLIHKHTVVVRVEAQERERQQFSQLGQRCRQNRFGRTAGRCA